jgi:hypothetical protein
MFMIRKFIVPSIVKPVSMVKSMLLLKKGLDNIAEGIRGKILGVGENQAD